MTTEKKQLTGVIVPQWIAVALLALALGYLFKTVPERLNKLEITAAVTTATSNAQNKSIDDINKKLDLVIDRLPSSRTGRRDR